MLQVVVVTEEPVPVDVLMETLGRVQEVVAEVPLPRVYLAARVPPLTDDAFHTAEVASMVLGGGRASRLYRSLVREQRVAKDVLAYLFPLQTSASLLLFWVTGFPDSDPGMLEGALVEELERLSSVEGPELDRAVALTETRLLQGLQQVGRRADLLSAFDQAFDDPGRLNEEVDRVRAVGSAQVEGFAGEYFAEDNRAVLTYIPNHGP